MRYVQVCALRAISPLLSSKSNAKVVVCALLKNSRTHSIKTRTSRFGHRGNVDPSLHRSADGSRDQHTGKEPVTAPSWLDDSNVYMTLYNWIACTVVNLTIALTACTVGPIVHQHNTYHLCEHTLSFTRDMRSTGYSALNIQFLLSFHPFTHISANSTQRLFGVSYLRLGSIPENSRVHDRRGGRARRCTKRGAQPSWFPMEAINAGGRTRRRTYIYSCCCW